MVSAVLPAQMGPKNTAGQRLLGLRTPRDPPRLPVHSHSTATGTCSRKLRFPGGCPGPLSNPAPFATAHNSYSKLSPPLEPLMPPPTPSFSADGLPSYFGEKIEAIRMVQRSCPLPPTAFSFCPTRSSVPRPTTFL